MHSSSTVWERHEARLILRGAARVRTVAATLGALIGLGLGAGVTRLLG